MLCIPKWNSAKARQRGRYLLNRFVPVTVWGPTLTPRIIVNDLICGIIVGIMIVPSSLSYASLANLPLTCGLMAAVFGAFVYGTLGQCAVLMVGPVAELTTLLISISSIPEDKREATYQLLGLQVGILAVALSFVDGGKIIKTIFAKAVGDGYTCAAAILAIAVQVKVMFNLEVATKARLHDVLRTTFEALIHQFSMKKVYCFLLFCVYCGYLILVKRAHNLPKWIPHQLFVVVVSILITRFARLDEVLDLDIVRSVPSEISPPRLPKMDNLLPLAPYTLAITIISFVQMYVIAKRVMPEVEPNAELFADGVANFVSNIFGGMPVTNSFSCSALLIEQGAKTPLTAYSAGTVVLITVVGLTRLDVFYYLPRETLAAIVVSCVWRLIDFAEPLKLWRQGNRMDALVWCFTFLLTVFAGITVGVLCGIALSLVLVVIRVARPRAVSLGFNMATLRYGDLSKDPELLVYPHILMWRFDAPLYFINTGWFQDKLVRAVQDEIRPISIIIVTCSKMVDMDAAALYTLPHMLQSVAQLDPHHPRRVFLTAMQERVERMVFDSGILPPYLTDEYERMSVAEIARQGRFPVVFRSLEDCLVFAQRCIAEMHGGAVDAAPYPNVAFVTDAVVAAAKLRSGDATTALTHHRREEEKRGGVTAESSRTANAARYDDDEEDEDMSETESGRVRRGARPLNRRTVTHAHTLNAPSHMGHGNASTASSHTAADMFNNNNSLCASICVDEDHLVDHLKKLKRISRYTPKRELIGVIGVVRHTELTPKQKKKFYFDDPTLLQLAFAPTSVSASTSAASALRHGNHTRRTIDELEDFFAAVETGLKRHQLRRNAHDWRRVLAIVRSRPAGLTIQIKPAVGSEVHPIILDHAVAPPHRPLDGALYFTETPSASAPMTPRYRAARNEQQEENDDDEEDEENNFPTAGRAPWLMAGAPPHVTSNTGCSVERRHTDPDSTLSSHGASPPRHRAGALAVPTMTGAMMVVKWGGVLTRSGIAQARVLGEKLFARFFAAGDLPLHRLLEFTRLVSVTAADENRVIMTALAVMHALMQSRALTKSEIRVDDELMKTLSAPARRLLHEEYRYFERMLHMSSHAAARHFFHIPGFRRMLTVPTAEQTTVNHAVHGGGGVNGEHDEVANEVVDDAREPIVPDPNRSRPLQSSLAGGAHAHGAYHTHTARAAASTTPTTATYLTPLQVLQELERVMGVIVHASLPDVVRNVPLHDHETLRELQARYAVMLSNYQGAKARVPHRGSAEDMVRHGGDEVERVGGGVGNENDAHRGQDGAGGDTAGGAAVPETSSAPHYDVSDAAKIRDYASYDMAYNIPILHAVYEATQLQSLAALMHALQQVCTTAENMSRIGENVLEGVNSSKRFIIGSLVSGALMQRIYADFCDFARIDEDRMRRRLLRRAQQIYMDRHGGVKQEWRHAMQFLRRLTRRPGGPDSSSGGGRISAAAAAKSAAPPRRPRTSTRHNAMPADTSFSPASMHIRRGSHTSPRDRAEDEEEDEDDAYADEDDTDSGSAYDSSGRDRRAGHASTAVPMRRRRRFPFVALPTERVILPRRAHHMHTTHTNSSSSPSLSSSQEMAELPHTRRANEEEARTRFYFSSYLHVEGVRHCLFESGAIRGFSAPCEEDVEASTQLYMRHLIFKVFRRRHLGFTDADALAAMTRLRLLFRSHVSYRVQQHQLCEQLRELYHAMYYISMEVYYSVGDGGDPHAAEATRPMPVFTLTPRAEGGGSGVAVAVAAAETMTHEPHASAPPVTCATSQQPAGLTLDDRSPPLVSLMNGYSVMTAHGGGHAAPIYSPSGTSVAPETEADDDTSEERPVAAVASAGQSHHRHRRSSSSSSSSSTRTGHHDIPASPPLISLRHSAHGSMSSTLDKRVGSASCSEYAAAAHPTVPTSPLVAGTRMSTPAHSTTMYHRPTNREGSALIMATPPAGLQTAHMQQMRDRVSTVTSMRRIHEGISLDDFWRLIVEVKSAIQSQTLT